MLLFWGWCSKAWLYSSERNVSNPRFHCLGVSYQQCTDQSTLILYFTETPAYFALILLTVMRITWNCCLVQLNPVHMYSDKIIFVNGDFFPSFPSFHMLTAFLGTKVASFWKWSGSRVEFFESAGFLFSCGQKKIEVFIQDDDIHDTVHAL